MSNKKPNYVKQSQIKKLLVDTNYLVLLGERASGKSYASKNLILSECIKNNKEFIYLRRYDLDTKDSLCVNYFGDCPVEQLTNGEYTCIDVWRKGIYLSTTDENGKVIHGKKVGYCHALSASEHYKSLAFPDVQYILFEELISQDGRYLMAGNSEPSKLQQYVSTIFRHRLDGKVILIGNTISRICPYYREWNLKIREMKLGEITTYTYHNDNGEDTKIKVFITDSLNYNTGMFFGLSAKNITKGAYEVSEQPHLPKSKLKYKDIYTLVVEYNEFRFLCSLLQDKENGSLLWFIEPKTTEIKAGTRVISNQFYDNPLATSTFRRPLTDVEARIFNLFSMGKVCYADNLTGTEFNNIIEYVR